MSIEITNFPELTSGDKFTLILAMHGNDSKPTYFFYEGKVYYVYPSDVIKARSIVTGMSEDEVIDLPRKVSRLPFLTIDNDMTWMINYFGNRFDDTVIYYQGKAYDVSPRFFKIAKRTIRDNRNGFKLGFIDELTPGDALTYVLANCPYGNYVIYFKTMKYRIGRMHVDHAKSMVFAKPAKTVDRKWRAAVMERDNHTCQHCGSHDNLHAHHILGRASYPELAKDVDNGIILCAECHKRFHQLYGYTGFTQTDLIKFMKFD